MALRYAKISLSHRIRFLLLAAADAAEQAKPPGEGADACALVSKAEIEQALGVKLTDGVKYPPADPWSCVHLQITRLPAAAKSLSPFGAGRSNTKERQPGCQEAGRAAGAHPGTRERCVLTETSAGETSIENLSIFRADYDYISIMFMGSSPVKPISAALEKAGRLVLDGWK